MVFCVPGIVSNFGTSPMVELFNACLVIPVSVLDCTVFPMDRPMVVVFYIVVEFGWCKCTASPGRMYSRLHWKTFRRYDGKLFTWLCWEELTLLKSIRMDDAKEKLSLAVFFQAPRATPVSSCHRAAAGFAWPATISVYYPSWFVAVQHKFVAVAHVSAYAGVKATKHL